MTVQWLTVKIVARCIAFTGLYSITPNVSAQVQPDTKRVIFLKETQILCDLIEDTAAQRFTPTVGDMDSVDSLLGQYFKQKGTGNIPQITIHNYYRQFAGFWINGKRCVFVNASCRYPDYFLQNTYYPRGGGQCYFRAMVDLDNRKMIGFYFNAPR